MIATNSGKHWRQARVNQTRRARRGNVRPRQQFFREIRDGAVEGGGLMQVKNAGGLFNMGNGAEPQ
jgi:hypothetical protein